MKKKAIIGILLTGMMILTGCNRQIIDTHWTFKYADIAFSERNSKLSLDSSE